MNEKSNKEWHAITVSVPKEGSDWISHVLFELGSIGNLEEAAPDPMTTAIKGYFPTDLGSSNAITQSILEMLRCRDIEPLSIFSTTIKIENWAKQAEQNFSPIKILRDLTIINPWSDYTAAEGETTITINPGMAFGTGLHATTQLAAELMTDVIENNNITKMCDVGCGSAILSLIANKKGVNEIHAVEIDSDARISAEENIEKNHAKEFIKLSDHIDKVDGKSDLVVANILYTIIYEIKDELIGLVKDNGFLVLSGVTTDEDKKLVERFNDSRLKLIEKKTKDNWMGYLYKVTSG